MHLSREFFDPGVVFVPCLSVVTGLLTLWVVPKPFEVRTTPLGESGQLTLAVLVSGIVALLTTGNGPATLAVAAIAAAFSLALKAWLPRLTMVGALEMAQQPLALLVLWPWTYLLLRDLSFPPWALMMVMASGPLAAIVVAVNWCIRLARLSMTTHASWRRPTKALPPLTGPTAPKVSIHLPCYAEPPEVVIATINSLARLDYANFEVLVCDNNTEDEALWRPLADHCARLNRSAGTDKFRFFHVAPIAGAKAGALNFCLQQMAPDAELVSVIDADYIAEPDFLARLVGFFENPKIGYVQAPHDYRGFEESIYLRTCYWDYMPGYKVEFTSINEYDAAFTIGTMCLFRASALIEAGRWGEWCLTEDSEVSVRLRALGYEGVYLNETFGRGLIPETFEDYKKQRFRWTAGPIQQVRQHWKLMLPRPFGAPGLGGWSKLLEISRSLLPFFEMVRAFFTIATTLLLAVLTLNGALPAMSLPGIAWVALALSTAARPILSAQKFRLAGSTRLTDMVLASVMGKALTYVRMQAALAGLSRKPLEWRRTPKFKAKGSGLRALQATLPEFGIGLALLMVSGAPWALSEKLGWEFALFMTIGIAISALRFLCAPLMSLMSERRLAAIARVETLPVPDSQSSLLNFARSPTLVGDAALARQPEGTDELTPRAA